MSQTKRPPPNPNPPIPAHKFAGPYTSPLLLSLPGSTDLQSRYAHLNCSFVSPQLRHGHGHNQKAIAAAGEEPREQPCSNAPTLVDLKRHVQSLCNLIVDLTAWEGPIDACYNPQHNDKNAFDWLDSLRSNTPYATYPPDAQGNGGGGDISSLEPWQSAPLTSVLNRYWETPELSAEEKKKRQGKDKNQLPPVPMPCPLAPDYKGADDIGTIVAHVNELFEDLEERLVDKGGILALYPVSSEVGFGDEEEEEEDEGEGERDVQMGGVDEDIPRPSLKFKRPTTSKSALEASKNTIFGQYLSYTSALAHRVTTLETELEAAQTALAGEACVPHVLANGVIPMPTTQVAGNDNHPSSRTQGDSTGSTAAGAALRPLLSSQDRYVLANLSPELDARICARLSHDSRTRSSAERETHEKIRPGRTRRDYVPSAPAPKPRSDNQYHDTENDSRGARSSQATPPPPPPAPPATPITATATIPTIGTSSTKRRRGDEDEDEDEEEEESPSPTSSSNDPLTTTFRDMDVDDTLLPSSHQNPLTPISYVDIPARAYRVNDASKTIFIVLGVGMGPEVRVGEGVSCGSERVDGDVGAGVVGREELVDGFKKWKKKEGKGVSKGKGKVGVDTVAPAPAPASASALSAAVGAFVRPMSNASVPAVSIPGPGGRQTHR